MTRPAETVLLAEKHSRETTFWCGNTSGFSPNSMICGPYFISDNIQGWGDHQLPDGTRPATNPYPNGPNGCVSANHAEVANFAFCDGHVKAMKPSATNPNPAARPQDDMWNGLR